MPGGITRFNEKTFQELARKGAALERLRRQLNLAVERANERGNGMVLFHQRDWWAVKIALEHANTHHRRQSDDRRSQREE